MQNKGNICSSQKQQTFQILFLEAVCTVRIGAAVVNKAFAKAHCK